MTAGDLRRTEFLQIVRAEQPDSVAWFQKRNSRLGMLTALHNEFIRSGPALQTGINSMQIDCVVKLMFQRTLFNMDLPPAVHRMNGIGADTEHSAGPGTYAGIEPAKRKICRTLCNDSHSRTAPQRDILDLH